MSQSAHNRSNDVPSAGAVLDDGTCFELVCSAARRHTAFAVWRGSDWRIEQHYESGRQRFVPYSANNNLIRHGVVLFPSEPSEYGSEDDLVADIQRFIHRYVDVSERFERIAAFYVLLTWVYDAFEEIPYLRLRGEYGSGKTRFLLIVGSIAYKPIFASGASTVSPIFHALDAFRGTLVIDEADFRFSDQTADIVKILNNGTTRGLPVLRAEVSNTKEYNPRAYDVFGPKLVATRGYYDDRALESRFITEEMGTRRLRRDIPIILRASYRDEALELRNKLLLYRFRKLRDTYAAEDLVDPYIEPRLNQMFIPLLSVVHDEAAREELKSLARSYHRNIVADRSMGLEAQVLAVVRDLFKNAQRPYVSVAEVTQSFSQRFGTEYEGSITNRWVGGLIRRSLKLETQKSHGIYVIPLSERPKLELLYEKYGLDGDAPLGNAEPAQSRLLLSGGDVGDVGGTAANSE